GSTFKIVTAGGLIETHSVAVSDSFDAENGSADLGYGRFRDTHPHGMLTFAEAFCVSSNIVMAKASRELDAEEFYRFVRLFGFGARTGVRMFGESAGSVPAVAQWSLRTQSTMAFGQEIAVTPLQMLNAMAAIANDGVMLVPRFVLGVLDKREKVSPPDPVKIRRVVSKRTARVLKEMCRQVVVEGTGTAAAMGFLDVSGKTGTAQKASSNGYLHNKYVASFVGFAPSENPKIVCLVILDEPNWAGRYGGTSAAPVFARVCRAIANTTRIFDAELAHDAFVAREDPRPDSTTPNFLRMERSAALEYARTLGANVLCQGESGRVVDQVPDPDVPMDRDDVVRLFVSNGDAIPGEVPDLVGMSIREARRVATRLGLRTRFVGTGWVREQTPAPGFALARQTIRLYGDDRVGQSAGSSR
ncbi:MAG: PASTA domain-containing protein, partial [Candidatus Krumholzibacteriota bacterium]|nr:PASTA domain-containing protein [Candidatus Krumholzibacteriota bacterium]